MDNSQWNFELYESIDVITCRELVIYLLDELNFPQEDMKELESEYLLKGS